MTSEEKIEANRQNAQKSTGPRTPEGKAVASRNALRHGLLSQQILLPGEDSEALRELSERLRLELQPVGELESLLVDQIIAAVWRLRRIRRVEAGIFAWELYGELAERAEQEASSYERRFIDLVAEDTERFEKADQATKYAAVLESIEITDEAKHQEALSKAREMRAEQDTETATLGRTFVRDADRANAFSKLSRYETAIERQLYRALHELERLQVARSGGEVPVPVALDVDVSGIPEGDR